MGLFSRKKTDFNKKSRELEKAVWDLENKQIVYLDKLKSIVEKQAAYKVKGKAAADKNMQRHYAGLYLSCEKEKEQIAYSVNEISKEILTHARMAQLVDTQALNIELEKMQTLSLSEISAMSDSITKSREKREVMSGLKNEAIDKALKFTPIEQNDEVDQVLGLWEDEKAGEDELKLSVESGKSAQDEHNTPVDNELRNSVSSGENFKPEPEKDDVPLPWADEEEEIGPNGKEKISE